MRVGSRVLVIRSDINHDLLGRLGVIESPGIACDNLWYVRLDGRQGLFVFFDHEIQELRCV
jgi:hypothetical protein